MPAWLAYVELIIIVEGKRLCIFILLAVGIILPNLVLSPPII